MKRKHVQEFSDTESKRIRYSEPLCKRFIAIPEIIMVHTKKSLILKTTPQDFFTLRRSTNNPINTSFLYNNEYTERSTHENNLKEYGETLKGLDKELREIEAKIIESKNRLNNNEARDKILKEQLLNIKIESQAKKLKESIKAHKKSTCKIKEEIMIENKSIEEKKKEVNELKRIRDELIEEHKKCMIEELNLIREDFKIEHLIHRIKRKLYTILILNAPISSMKTINTFKFDSILDKNLCECFDHITYLTELINPMVNFFMRSDYKNLTYFVISLNKELLLLVKYIDNLLNHILYDKILTIHELNSKIHRKLNKVKEIEDYIESNKDKNLNLTIKIMKKSITFVLLNVEYINNTDYELNTIFNSVQIGYLMLVINSNNKQIEEKEIIQIIERVSKVAARIRSNNN